MQKIILSYGSETREVTVATTATIGDVVRNATTKAILGYGDNVKALVFGVEQPMEASVQGISAIDIETRSNSKAV